MDIQQNQHDNCQHQMLVDHDNTQVNMVLYSVFSSGEVDEHYQLNKDGTLLSLYGTDISEAMEQFMRKLIAVDAIPVDDASAEVLEHVMTTFGIDQTLTSQFTQVCDDGNTLISTIWRDREELEYEYVQSEPENFITQITENVYIRVLVHKGMCVVFFLEKQESSTAFKIITVYRKDVNEVMNDSIDVDLDGHVERQTIDAIHEVINKLIENQFSNDYLDDNFVVLDLDMYNVLFKNSHHLHSNI